MIFYSTSVLKYHFIIATSFSSRLDIRHKVKQAILGHYSESVILRVALIIHEFRSCHCEDPDVTSGDVAI